MIISIFIPHGGCPVRCTFCDQKTSGGDPTSPDVIIDRIEAHLRKARLAEEIAFYGATFTALPARLQESYLKAALPYLKNGEIGAVRISTRPDAIDEKWLSYLKEKFYLRTVEIGVQSFTQAVLDRLGRRHTVEDVYRSFEILKKLSLRTGLHLMVGMPHESDTEDESNLSHTLQLKPDFVRVHPLLVFNKTKLADEVLSGRFVPIELENAVERCAKLVQSLENNSIPVQRIGLQPNEVILAELLAGPFHPAFGELVRSRILRKKIASVLEQMDLKCAAAVEITVPARLESQARGNNSCNIKWLIKNFHLTLPGQYMIKTVGHGNNLQIRVRNALGSSQFREIDAFQ